MRNLYPFCRVIAVAVFMLLGMSGTIAQDTQQQNVAKEHLSVEDTVTLNFIPGEPWRRQAPAPTAFPIHSMTSSDANTAWAVGDSGTIIATTDGGENWVLQTSPREVNLWSVTLTDVNHLWICGEDGVILTTTDGGQTWQEQASGLTTDLFSIHFIDAQHGWAVGEEGTILRTTDGGNFWLLLPQISGTSNRYLRGVHFISATEGWLVGGGTATSTNGYFIYHTTDGGYTWTEQKKSSSGGSLTTVSFVDTLYGWAVGYQGSAFQTTNGGATWTAFDPVSSIIGGTANYLGVKFLDQQRGFIWGWRYSSESGLERKYLLLQTTDGGTSWTSFAPESYCEKQEGFYIGGLAVADTTTWWAGCTRGIIYRTTDGGHNWLGQTAATAADFYGVSFGDRDHGWAVGQYGLIAHTADGG
ncbi:hypothetical protein DRQ15_11270, partial [candidate division KSB1 bacterium]